MAPEALSVMFCVSPDSVPTGTLEFARLTALRISSSEMLRAAAADGSTWTRIAKRCEPKICTWATPWIWEICWASTVSAYSLTTCSGSVADRVEMNRIGKSPGLTLRNWGGVVISGGSRRAAVESAVCTSSAALSMSRTSSN